MASDYFHLRVADPQHLASSCSRHYPARADPNWTGCIGTADVRRCCDGHAVGINVSRCHVSKCDDPKRPCALKLIRPDVADVRLNLKRFEREVQSTARLPHWNTVEIYDYGNTDDSTFYYVMEYLPGMNLDEVVRRDKPLPACRAVYLLQQVCEALAEAHDQGLIHRDIKPANIFSAIRGGRYDVVKLLDFGLVRQTRLSTSPEEHNEHQTSEGSITGSPLYLSPEQALGEVPDERSDIYLTGRGRILSHHGTTAVHE